MNTTKEELCVHTCTFLVQISMLDVIPILPEKTSFKYNIPGQKGYNVSRSQLQLLPAYAYTTNKIQGQSLKHALVDLKSARGTQALYVMISHAMALDNLVIT